MTEMFIGYARVSTDAQDLTAQRNALTGLGVAAERVYVDQGRSATTVTGRAWRAPSPPAGPATPS